MWSLRSKYKYLFKIVDDGIDDVTINYGSLLVIRREADGKSVKFISVQDGKVSTSKDTQLITVRNCYH